MALPFLFLDLETTGHDALRLVDGVFTPWHEVIEFAAVLTDPLTLEVRANFVTKIRPVHPERCIPDIVNHYPRRAAAGEWNGALPLERVIRLFLNWHTEFVPEGKSVPAGQNPAFDWSFLTVGFARCGISPEFLAQFFHYAKLDTRSMAVQALWAPGTAYDPNAYSLRNERLASVLGIPMEPYPHEALNGARQALAVFRRLREMKHERR